MTEKRIFFMGVLIVGVTLLLFGLQGGGGAEAAHKYQSTAGDIYMPIVYKQPSPTAVPDSQIIIDHRHANITLVPDSWIELAKTNIRVSYGHTSHGSQLITGAAYWRILDPSLAYTTNGTIQTGLLSLHDYTPAGDLGSPDRYTWASRTRTYLNGPTGTGPSRNVVMWSWCGQAETTADNIQIYLDLMTQLEIDYPSIKFIYMTGHLNSSGSNATIHARNQQIRDHVLANPNRVLFDFADIESYDPSGTYYANGTDGCSWCTAWCTAHSGDCADLNLMNDCAHSHKFNCKLKGQAFWWMMARLAGWSG